MLLYSGLAKGIIGLNGLGMLGRRQASVNTGAFRFFGENTFCFLC